jgi:hypothetical protein
MILINYVVTCYKSHSFFLEKDYTPGTDHSDTFLEAILRYSTHDELKIGGELAKPLFTTRDEDVEFKKLLWTCVLYLVRDPENVEAHKSLIDNRFLEAILMYLNPSSSSLSTHRWQPPQLKEI